MTISMKDMKGMSAELAEKLATQGITNSEHFVTAARTPAGRKTLAASLEISTKDLMEFANRADLARIKGVGAAFADMLENAGVDTVKELSTRKPENLHAKIMEAMEGQAAISKPSLEKVQEWVAEAKTLGAGLEY